MKSIKEKAEEHLNSVYAGYDDVLKELVKASYVSGANYVLDHLSKTIAVSEDGYLLDNTKKMIEQLKK